MYDWAFEGTAREILGDVEIDEESNAGARDDLKQMLVDIIMEAGGLITTKALMAEVRDSGHSWDTATHLKKSMGIESHKLSMGAPWMRFLATAAFEEVPKGAKGAQKIKRSRRSRRCSLRERCSRSPRR